VPFLAQEDVEDAVAFARTLAAGRAQAGKIQSGAIRR
jgi:ADP-dependent phosphofructokinase/glucokinase